MVAVLDQYEVEYKETYTSGTYDQVVMGKMFYPITILGIKKYVYGDRGVVYGAINSDQAPTPGTGIFDFSNSLSYRLQPYREKAGNCKAAKHACYEERIYDTLTPNPMACFKLNGASVFAIKAGNPNISPGESRVYSGVETMENAFIMFDNYVPPESSADNLNNSSTTISRKIINPGVDKFWTKSFPFEPRYSSVKREKQQNFNNIETNLIASFYYDTGANITASFYNSPIRVKRSGLIVGTVGHLETSRHNRISGSYSPPLSGNFYHRWAVDVDLSKKIPEGVAPYNNVWTSTGSCGPSDMMKVLFGFGDANTVFYDNQLISSTDPTGYARRGTNNWPEFRLTNPTGVGAFNTYYGYEVASGSLWCVSPIIRGWKYGLHNGLPDFSSAYFRQGKYGQFRDMLEQRLFTVFSKDDSQNFSSTAQNKNLLTTKVSTDPDGPVAVKFLDSNENLTKPINTQSQNLSIFATSSLPYFDLQQRNRPQDTPLTNLSLINFSLDNAGNITI